jgi:Ribonuclease G/E
MAIEIVRLLHLSAARQQIKQIKLFVSPEVAEFLNNEKRTTIAAFEQLNDKRVIIHADLNYSGEKHQIVCYNSRGSVVKL